MDAVGSRLLKPGVRGRKGKGLDHTAVANFLAQPALFGGTHARTVRDDGASVSEFIDARWPPLVDPAKRKAVSAEHGRRAKSPRNRRRKKRESYPLSVRCAECGQTYQGGTGSKRSYRHVVPKNGVNPEAHARWKEHECKQWKVSADEVEDAVYDLIGRLRGSEEFAAKLKRALIEDRQLLLAHETTIQDLIEASPSEGGGR